MRCSLSDNQVMKYALLVIFILLILIEIWVLNRLSTYGSVIQSLEVQKETLVLENRLLEMEIAKQSSLQGLEPKARSLGFESIRDLEFIR